MTTKFKKSFSPMLICWNDIKIHLGFEDSYFVPPPNYNVWHLQARCKTALEPGSWIWHFFQGAADFDCNAFHFYLNLDDHQIHLRSKNEVKAPVFMPFQSIFGAC